MPSRRDQIEMTPEELRNYITTEKTLIIVSNGLGGFPHPMPMFFTVDEQNRFYVTTFRKSQKVMNFKRDPKASLLIESGTVYSDLKSMLAYATAEIIDALETTLDVMTQMGEKDARLGYAAPLSRDQVKATAEKRVVLRFTAEKFITWDHTKLGGKY